MFEEKKLAIVLPERLGDALFNTPSIAFIQHHYPSASLDAICLSPVSAAVVQNNPAINHVYIKPSKSRCQKLKLNYDHIIFLSNYERHFPDYIRYFGKKSLVLKDIHKSAHLALQKLQFLEKLTGKTIKEDMLAYQLYPSATDDKKIKLLFSELGLDKSNAPVIGLHLGCHRIAKRWWRFRKDRFNHKKVWPLENFVALCKALKKNRPDIRFVVTGTKAEAAMIKDFCQSVPGAIDFANKTSVLQAASLMKHLSLYLACDTGTTHIAYSMNTPTVVLFGPTNFTLTGPFPDTAKVTPVKAESIDAITIEEVKKNIESLL